MMSAIAPLNRIPLGLRLTSTRPAFPNTDSFDKMRFVVEGLPVLLSLVRGRDADRWREREGMIADREGWSAR